MSAAAEQYGRFREQVVVEGRVFTFTDGGEQLVFPVGGDEVIPFWSSRSRLETIQRRLPKYRQWEITELSLAQFWELLAELERDGAQVGVNWSGLRLTGYNIPVPQLREAVGYWLDKLDKRSLLATRAPEPG